MTKRRISRRRISRRRIKGGGWNQIINQGIAPVALLGLSYVFHKKRSGKSNGIKRNKTRRKQY